MGLLASRLRFRATTALAVIALILAACGGGSNGPAGSATNQAAPPDEQVLNLRMTGEPKTIDPQKAANATDVSVIRQLFSTLFTYDDGLQIVPDLAAEIPTVDNGGISRDGKTYTIKLRKELKWSDGKPLTAADVVYGFKRMLDPRVAGPNTSNYYSIVGAKDYNSALGTKAAPKTPSDNDLDALRAAVGLQAPDTTTVVINLSQQNGSFLQQLSVWPSAPVRQDIVESKGDTWTEAGSLIGDGPFVLKEWVHADHFTLTPNPLWHRGTPKLRQVNIRLIDDDVTAFASYLTGELDAAAVPPANRREAMTPGSSLNAALVRKPALTTFALEFNNKEQPWDNAKVRQAFATAFDRKTFVDGVLQGVGIPTTTWVAPGMPGYDASLGKQYDFNAVKARQLLAEAGYPDGQGLPKPVLLMRTSDTNQIVAQYVQDQFKKVLGVDFDIEMADAATFSARFSRGQYNFTVGSWTAAWPYPDNWLSNLFSSGSSGNYFGYTNPKTDDLIQRASAELDRSKQLDLFGQAQKIVLDDAGVAPIYHAESFLVLNPRVRDFVVTGIDGNIKGDMNLWRTWIARSNS